ncbi:methyltransferase type 12 [Marichromatium purpuratum 984]|uniref:Methyltransferase type 12 n=1 Tax=Marichromatium purpuratum 984 TaxID=765910 RepID=W0E6F7_MARPU|nr:class I SAM-dependent methyltransferase [Marichromatium purpuratum]AHF04769.1 methyltransferase type 12 [Marichromatium purpuratum 984]
MPTVKEHYDNVLSDVYAWMCGGFTAGIQKNMDFFETRKITPTRSGVAIDLGAGCGFQSIPLARAGFSVTAIDTDRKLLDELRRHSGELPISVIQEDIVDFDKHTGGNAELIVCMTDTLIHLESEDRARTLFRKVISSLEEGGKFVVTFRDLSPELSELDRFILVRSDKNIIFTCFLEHERDTVKVYDLVHMREGEQWTLNKSYYRKLRRSKQWIDEQLSSIGFSNIDSTVDKGFVTVIATK